MKININLNLIFANVFFLIGCFMSLAGNHNGSMEVFAQAIFWMTSAIYYKGKA